MVDGDSIPQKKRGSEQSKRQAVRINEPALATERAALPGETGRDRGWTGAAREAITDEGFDGVGFIERHDVVVSEMTLEINPLKARMRLAIARDAA